MNDSSLDIIGLAILFMISQISFQIAETTILATTALFTGIAAVVGILLHLTGRLAVALAEWQNPSAESNR
jgi:hypothetical protein